MATPVGTPLGVTASHRTAPPFNPISSIGWSHAYWCGGPEFVALGLANGAAVSSWPDEVGTLDLAQADAGKRPDYRSAYAGLNSKPAIESTAASNDYIGATHTAVAQPFTVAVVAKFAAVNGVFLDLAGPWAIQHQTSWKAYGGSTIIGGGTADLVKHLFVFIANGASTKIIVDGVTVVTASAGTSARGGMGIFNLANAFATSAAAAFYATADSILSAGDQAALLAWSRAYYGTP